MESLVQVFFTVGIRLGFSFDAPASCAIGGAIEIAAGGRVHT